MLSPVTSPKHAQLPDARLPPPAGSTSAHTTAPAHSSNPPTLPPLPSLTASTATSSNIPPTSKPRGIGKDALISLLRRNNKTNRPLQQPDALLTRLTHLQLDDTRLTQIPAIDADERGWLELCSGARVLYLHNNCIRRLEGLEWASSVTHLYLSHNRLERMAGLSHMLRLEKLYLQHNCIGRLEALSPNDDSLASDAAPQQQQQTRLPLIELHLASQDLHADSAGLTFSPASLQSIAPTLTHLDVTSTRLGDEALASLSVLRQLSTLLAANNQLTSLPTLLALLPCLPRLATLRLDNNEVTRNKAYRTSVVRDGRSLVELDGKDVRSEERQFLYALEEKRRRASEVRRTKEVGKGSSAEHKDSEAAGEWKRVGGGEGDASGEVVVGSRQGSREGRRGSGVLLNGVGVVGVSAGHSRAGSRGDALPSAGIGLSAHHSRQHSLAKS